MWGHLATALPTNYRSDDRSGILGSAGRALGGSVFRYVRERQDGDHSSDDHHNPTNLHKPRLKPRKVVGCDRSEAPAWASKAGALDP